jgi:acyl-CoA reductase-like NAD-dependent aldehyde dehydrogenase
MPSPTNIYTDPAAACDHARRVWLNLCSHVTPVDRARLLTALAVALDHARAELITLAVKETRLLPAELAPEFDRCTGTLRLFARLLRTHDWRRPAIDRASARAIGPGHDVRSIMVPLGPIAVFGASNFPFAYGVLGGDSASALAAGCSVVVKEHPAHPRLGRALAALVARTFSASRWASARPRRVISPDLCPLVYLRHTDPRDLSVPIALIDHQDIHAVGFTGSTRAGLAIARRCAARADPIPSFCEMGSANAVFIADAAARQRAPEIARALATSILTRHGQQCTRPGLIFLDLSTPGGQAFQSALTRALADAPARDLLAPWIKQAYDARCEQIAAFGRKQGARVRTLTRRTLRTPRAAAPALFLCESLPFDTAPPAPTTPPAPLAAEVFGPCAILVNCPEADMPFVRPRASLTLTLFDETPAPATPHFVDGLLGDLPPPAGRVIFNGVPTGVRVCDAMVHGGPCPATNAPHTTAVGPRAIERWLRPVCFQNTPARAMPAPLRDAPRTRRRARQTRTA